jgi:hypothetical protein
LVFKEGVVNTKITINGLVIWVTYYT